MSSTSGSPLRKLAFIQGVSGQSQALRAALCELEPATQAEFGCLEFRFYQSLTQDDEFVLLESFVDAAAFDQHMQAAHTRAFFALNLTAGVKLQSLPAMN